jgi:hypothetical protein
MLASGLPWEYPSPIIYKMFKIILYLIPIIISLLSLVVLLKKNKHLFFVPTLVILYYLLSIRPTTDYVHLTPLIALSFISLIVIYPLLKKGGKAIIIIFALLFLIFGIYSSLFRNYYRWNAPLVSENYFLAIPHAYILTDLGTAQNAMELVKFIDSHTKKGEPIFIYGLNPMFYLLSERDNPTRYDYYYPQVQDSNSVSDATNILRNSKVKLIFSGFPLSRNAKDQNYILNNYTEIKYMGNYFYIKR